MLFNLHTWPIPHLVFSLCAFEEVYHNATYHSPFLQHIYHELELFSFTTFNLNSIFKLKITSMPMKFY